MIFFLIFGDPFFPKVAGICPKFRVSGARQENGK